MGILIYIALGALVMLVTFKIEKFKECIPVWYANYRVKLDSEGNRDVFTEGQFATVCLAAATLAAVVFWPVALAASVYKTVTRSK